MSQDKYLYYNINMRSSVFYKVLFCLSQMHLSSWESRLPGLGDQRWSHDLQWLEESSKCALRKETKMQLTPLSTLSMKPEYVRQRLRHQLGFWSKAVQRELLGTAYVQEDLYYKQETSLFAQAVPCACTTVAQSRVFLIHSGNPL